MKCRKDSQLDDNVAIARIEQVRTQGHTCTCTQELVSLCPWRIVGTVSVSKVFLHLIQAPSVCGHYWYSIPAVAIEDCDKSC